MLSNSICSISKNVEVLKCWIQSFEKIIFEHLKKATTSCGFIFLQQTHSTIHDEKIWNDKFKGKLCFSHGQSNSCGFTISFIGNTSFSVSNKKQDESGRILILDVKVSDNYFLLISLYNANKESEQLNTLSTISNLLGDITDLHCKNIILGGDFNTFFNLTCKARGKNPKMENKSVAKFIRFKESLGLCHIWQVRNSKKKRYTFRQRDVTGLTASFKED